MNARVREAIIEHLPRVPGRLLDLPSGDGWLSRAALRQGHHVLAGDLYTQDVGDIRFFLCDLNTAIPMRSECIDHVYCCEGIEHLYNTHTAISEFSRILKPAGLLVLTFPNILNIGSRFKFLFSGRYLSFPHLTEPLHARAGEYTHEHVNAISISQLNYIAVKCHLVWDGFIPQRYEMKKLLRRIWFLPVLQVIGRLKQLFARKSSARLLWSILSSRECLLHDHVIVRFRKGSSTERVG